MNTIQNLLNDLAEFEKSDQNSGYDLRLDLADIILRHLDGHKWTQAQLAKAAEMKDSYLTRVIHSSQNCTFEVAGRILHALGIQAKLVETPSSMEGTDNGQKEAGYYPPKDQVVGIVCEYDSTGETYPFRSKNVSTYTQQLSSSRVG